MLFTFLNFHNIITFLEALHDFSHGNAFAAAKTGGGEPVVDDAADELLYLVA